MITTLQAAHLPALYQIYCAQTAGVPHCLTPSLERFAADMLGYQRGTLLVVEDAQGHACGFAALAMLKDHRAIVADAVTALFFREDQHGRELLVACITRAQPGPLLAFPQAHAHGPVQGYNGGWDGLSDRMHPAARMLSRTGFSAYYREMSLICDFARFPPQLSAPVQLEIRQQLDADGLFSLRAFSGEREVAICLATPLAKLSDDPRAASIGYIEWLWVADDQRRRGVARYMLSRTLAYLHSNGMLAAWLTTGASNWPAQALYLALGFEIVDTSASYERTSSSPGS